MKLQLPKTVTTYTDTPVLFTAAQALAGVAGAWLFKKATKKAFGIEETTVKYKPKA